jgi:hypothetical protein
MADPPKKPLSVDLGSTTGPAERLGVDLGSTGDPVGPLGVDLGHITDQPVGPVPAVSLEEFVRRTAQSPSPPMPEQSAPGDAKERPGTKTLDYIALGLLLAPPAVVLDMYLKDHPINWGKVAIAAPVCWVAGGLAVLASHRWQSWRLADRKALSHLVAAENRFWIKGLIVAAAMGFALTLSSILSDRVSSIPPSVIHDPPTAQDIAKAAAPIRAERDKAISDLAAVTEERNQLKQQNIARQPEAISPLLRLDDAKRWAIVKSLRDSTRNNSGYVTCSAYIVQARKGNWPSAVWTELHPLLYYAGWQLAGSQTQKTYFQNGISVTSGSDKGDAFTCAWRLSELIQSFGIPSPLRINQVTPELIACKNECIGIEIGDEP